MGLGELTKKKATDYLQFSPRKVNIELNQHIGAPATAVINVGDTVTAGQLIAKANGKVSANIHASINGKVLEVLDKIVIEGEE